MKLKELAEKITPGRWEYDSFNTIYAPCEGPGIENGHAEICAIPDHPCDAVYKPEEITERGWWYAQSQANAELIEIAPSLLRLHLQLVEGLRNYGGHTMGCNTNMCWHTKHEKGCCDCGYTAILTEVEKLSNG